MLAFLFDEHLPPSLISGLRAREPSFDAVHVYDVGLSGTPDAEILEWAAQTNRIVVTNDRNTLLSDAYDRVTLGKPMPGVIVVDLGASHGDLIDNLILFVLCDDPSETVDQIRFIPL